MSSKIGRPDWTTSEPALAVVCQKSYLKLLYEGDTRNRWRDGPVCPDVDQELWRLGPDSSGHEENKRQRPEKNPERERKETEKKPGEKKIREKSEEEQKERTRDPERESAKPALNGEKGLSPEIGVKKTMNAGGVEHEYMN
ncbi:hypothetical protein TNCV_1038771 [Trichonephila clavipes]|uniref:Uncharacterized protein n=1 Tax=Trichonephila clavipes TaxID=2585209 RepID=A0A8X6VW63_TRICX|nr:hypothetical protein TNCV_1038771 [Trichonephila clavipes]